MEGDLGYSEEGFDSMPSPHGSSIASSQPPNPHTSTSRQALEEVDEVDEHTSDGSITSTPVAARVAIPAASGVRAAFLSPTSLTLSDDVEDEEGVAGHSAAVGEEYEDTDDMFSSGEVRAAQEVSEGSVVEEDISD